MSETTLYRKYRPNTFKDVIGQDHIVDTLRSEIKDDKIAHAYLFAGTRGTGKTSIARIFAREIGCTETDLYEIDAASNRGIDDIRELRDAVSTLPFESPVKVYIIDEVHMLTKEAFNALLKTLEEPPEHVVFILATTEQEKLPDTVVSRCQTFNFRTPAQSVLKDVSIDIAKKEGMTLDPSGAELIAVLGDGSFRDTLGILQKVLGISTDKKITAEEVEAVTGAPRRALIENVVEAIAEGKADIAIANVRKAGENNVNMKVFLKLLITKIRMILLLRVAPTMEAEIQGEVDEDDYAFMKKMSDAQNANLSSKSLARLLESYSMMGNAFIPELPIELAIMDILEGVE